MSRAATWNDRRGQRNRQGAMGGAADHRGNFIDEQLNGWPDCANLAYSLVHTV